MQVSPDYLYRTAADLALELRLREQENEQLRRQLAELTPADDEQPTDDAAPTS